jgi:hypothetical protein
MPVVIGMTAIGQLIHLITFDSGRLAAHRLGSVESKRRELFITDCC